jgi:hypothetical protein
MTKKQQLILETKRKAQSFLEKNKAQFAETFAPREFQQGCLVCHE